MSRDAKYFVNPDDFMPERWERETNIWNPFSNLPFGFGARSCVGRRIAQQELYLAMIKVFLYLFITFSGETNSINVFKYFCV